MNLKQQIVQAAYDAGEGHIPSALSIVDIVSVLYDKILGPDDRFILSKGHGSLALYVVLFTKGMISKEQLITFGKYGSILGGHPDRNKVPGVVASTGSLGHGLPIAVGIALAKKIKGEPGRVYCLVGDGECNEGSIWEAAMLAVHHKLYNLTVVVDYNHSTDRALYLGDIADKFRAFGFGGPSSPVADIVNTAKGNGCARMADPAWHHRIPNATELVEILKELE
jgi:transketolase